MPRKLLAMSRAECVNLSKTKLPDNRWSHLVELGGFLLAKKNIKQLSTQYVFYVVKRKNM
jgi:hypothetical protein